MLPFQKHGFLVISCCLSIALAEYSIHLLHVNDIHARFEETNKYSARCTQEDLGKNFFSAMEPGE